MNDEFDPLTGDPLPKSNKTRSVTESKETALTSDDLHKLADMSREQLTALVQRMYRQCGMVAAMSEDDTAQAMLDMLAHTALRPIATGDNMRADIQSRLSAIDKWLDRTKGKPVANVKVDNTISMLVSNVKTDQALLARIKADLIAGTYGETVIEHNQ